MPPTKRRRLDWGGVRPAGLQPTFRRRRVERKRGRENEKNKGAGRGRGEASGTRRHGTQRHANPPHPQPSSSLMTPSGRLFFIENHSAWK